MCGIAGIFNLNGEPVSPVILKRMTDVIAHRGPDGEGHYINGAVGLGHRRLAIIDLSPAGHQPMLTRDGRYAITYNGEIYNFRELRIALESLGHQFHSRTDSEVVLQAYLQWGVQCVDRFNGMFAFAIWDNEQRRLFFARDRYGIKPLYYTLAGATFLFASEQKALLQHPSVQRSIDLEALLEYFTFQNIFTDRTLLKEIRLLPAGHYARLDSATGQFVKTQYWDFDFQEPDKQIGRASCRERV